MDASMNVVNGASASTSFVHEPIIDTARTALYEEQEDNMLFGAYTARANGVVKDAHTEWRLESDEPLNEDACDVCFAQRTKCVREEAATSCNYCIDKELQCHGPGMRNRTYLYEGVTQSFTDEQEAFDEYEVGQSVTMRLPESAGWDSKPHIVRRVIYRPVAVVLDGEDSEPQPIESIRPYNQEAIRRSNGSSDGANGSSIRQDSIPVLPERDLSSRQKLPEREVAGTEQAAKLPERSLTKEMRNSVSSQMASPAPHVSLPAAQTVTDSGLSANAASSASPLQKSVIGEQSNPDRKHSQEGHERKVPEQEEDSRERGENTMDGGAHVATQDTQNGLDSDLPSHSVSAHSFTADDFLQDVMMEQGETEADGQQEGSTSSMSVPRPMASAFSSFRHT